MRKFIFIWSCLLLISFCQAAIITVDDDGPADFDNIQAAIDDSNDGDIIEVQPGTYTDDGNRDIDFGGKAITVRSVDPNDPCIVAATIIDCNGGWLDGHRGFYFHSGEEPNSVLDGLTINKGVAWGENGGGILTDNSSPTIRNCIICNNTAKFNMIEGGSGGGISCENDSNPKIIDCIIILNFSDYAGAGISCLSSSPMISDCTINNGESEFHGGGIYCEDNSSPSIINCTIKNNCVTQYGAGIVCFKSNPEIQNCTISGNSAGFYGGGITSIDGNPTLLNCVIVGNYASDSGGGIYYGADTNSSVPLIINCTITNNRADGRGGGLSCFYNNPIIINSIFWDNAASSGSQIALLLNPSWPSTLSVLYCDIQGSQADVYIAEGCSLNWLTGNICLDPCFPAPGCWDANGTPNDVNDDFWVDGDYHLKSEAGRWDPNTSEWVTDTNTSPCIDAGDPASDWTEELWPHGKRINMGAYGGTPEASMSLSDVGNVADLNNDGFIDYGDVMLFKDEWLTQEVLLSEDLDRNGVVDFLDFAILANNWSKKALFDVNAPDLIVEFGTVKLPVSVVSKERTRITLPLVIANIGNIAVERKQKIGIQIFVRPLGAVDDSKDVLVTTLKNKPIGNLGVCRSKKIKARIELPSNLAQNDYVLVAKVDSSDDVAESNETNNTTVTNKSIEVAEGYVDLIADIGSKLRFPDSVIAGDDTKITLPIAITNGGNITITHNQKIDIQIFVRPLDAVDDSNDVLVTTLKSKSISNLGVGRSKKINAKIELPSNLAQNDYVLVAKVDSSDDVAESNETNNTAVTSVSIQVREPYKLEDLYRYEVLGANWNYRSDYILTINGQSESDTTTATVAVEDELRNINGYNCYVINLSYGNLDIKGSEAWYKDLNGTYITSITSDDDVGQIVFILDPPLLVAPSLLYPAKRYRYSGPVTGTIPVQIPGSSTVNANIEGKVSSSIKIRSEEQVTVPMGTYNAVKAEESVIFRASFKFSYKGKTFKGNVLSKGKETWWAVPDVGVVKCITSVSTAAGVPGHKRVSLKLTSTNDLTGYSD